MSSKGLKNTDQGENNTSMNVMPSSALHVLNSPDGFYTYLNIAIPDRNPGVVSSVDVDIVKKNYRRLSLKHHPDRRGGDATTFRVLNRAKKVLATESLRKQYDLLGLDLDDDEKERGESSGDDDEGGDSESDSVVAQLASMTLSSLVQIVARTVMICCVSTLISRYLLLMLPLNGFLLFVCYQVKTNSSSVTREVAVPLLLCIGVILMYIGRRSYSIVFWLGETVTISMVLNTSLPTEKSSKPIAIAIIAFLGAFFSFLLKGRFWRYSILLGIEAGLAVIAVLIFPIMEMILEEIIN